MRKRPNIMVLNSDSLRADHLGCYGYDRATSPHIDAMARESVVCEQMYCPVIPTQPSHTTMFTGQHPLRHGVVAHGGKAKLARSSPFVSELLLEAGYATCTVDTLIRERMWFARGYEHIIDPSIRHVFYANVTQEELNERAIQWISTVPKGPFFMFIHYWDTHYPYTPPQRHRTAFYNGGRPVDPNNHALDEWWSHPIGALARDTWLRTPEGTITDPEFVTGLYDSELFYFDEGIATLNAALERLGIADDTMIIMLSDHGESMTEHRIFYDHYGLYDCTLRVPFIVKWPAGDLKAGWRHPHIRQSIDLAPTILQAAKVRVPTEMDGQSLLKQFRGEEEPAGYEKVVSMEATWQAKYSLRTGRHKFILSREQDLLGNPPRELYDLQADGNEEHNLVEREPELAANMESELEAAIAAKLKASGRTADPVKEEGASMVATWKGHRKASVHA